jgi:hypothetical protein
MRELTPQKKATRAGSESRLIGLSARRRIGEAVEELKANQ